MDFGSEVKNVKFCKLMLWLGILIEKKLPSKTSFPLKFSSPVFWIDFFSDSIGFMQLF